MTRPSSNTKQKLIYAGKALIPKTGFTNLKVREVAKKAGVNLGMFNYHFKTKENFIQELLQNTYEEFFQDFQIESKAGKNPLERFQNAIMSIGRFARDNRSILLPLVMEMNQGNKRILEFAKQNMTKHVEIILDLLKACQEEGYVHDESILNIAPIIMGSVAIPLILLNVFEKCYANKLLSPIFIKGATQVLLSDASMKHRIDLIFNGVAKEKCHEKE